MDILTIITVLIIISAGFSYLNERFIKLPGTIGVMSISVVVSIVVLIIGKLADKKSGLIITLAHNINFFRSAAECDAGLFIICKRPAF